MNSRILTYKVLILAAYLYCNTGISQSSVRIQSNDSTEISLFVNTELVLFSSFNMLELEFPSQSMTHLSISDSAQVSILERTINLRNRTCSEYILTKDSSEFNLSLVAQYNLDEEVNSPETAELSFAKEESTEQPLDSILKLTILSEFKSAESEFRDKMSSLDKLDFERDKIRTIEQLILSDSPTSSELIIILSKISYEDKKAALILKLKNELSGKLTSSDLDKLFKLNRYKEEIKKALNLD